MVIDLHFNDECKRRENISMFYSCGANITILYLEIKIFFNQYVPENFSRKLEPHRGNHEWRIPIHISGHCKSRRRQ